jgi:hypothetical protein
MVDTIAVGHSYDGSKYTVNDLIKAPKRVPNLVRSLVQDNDISPWMLRTGPTADGGAVVFEENVALYARDDAEVVAEFGEIPMTSSDMTVPTSRATTKRGLGLKISKEMVTRNDTGRVQEEIRKVRDKIVRGRERRFFQTIMAADANLVPASNVTGGWLSGANTGIIKDLTTAMYAITNQAPQGALENEKLGYTPDTLVIHPSYQYSLIDNAELNNIFAGSPLASQQLRYTGKLPKKFLNLDVLMSWSVPVTTAIVAQRKALGFISTEWPLNGSPLEYERSTESYTTYFSYRDVVVIDNPKAVAFIQGIDS